MSNISDNSYLKVRELLPYHKDKCKQRTTFCTTSCAVLAVALIISLTLNAVVSLYLWAHKHDEGLPRPHRDRLVSAVHGDSVCTGCLPLGVNPEYPSSTDHRDLNVHQLPDGTYLCCLQNAKGLWTLVQLFADRHQVIRHQNTVEQLANQKPTGAHLFVDSEALKKNPKTLSWTTEYGFGSSYSSSDVIINDNQLHVTRPGLYHVYSFITFKTRQPRLRPEIVLQTINRRNKHLPRLGSHVMLIDKTTLPEVSERFMTSFLSATVRLRKDDQLFVKVSNLSYVYEYAPSNFFGLFYMGE